MPATTDWHPTRYLASLYSPSSGRAVLDALFGIESEIVASLHGGLDHSVAHIRLQWWREECERTVSGRPVHPFTQALVTAHVQQLVGLPGFVDVAVWDLANATFDTRRELAAYCERWAAAMLVPAAAHATAGATDPGLWLAMGGAMHEIEMLANLASEAHSGRLRLPLDELEGAATAPECVAMTPWPAGLARLLAGRHEALRRVLTDSVASIDRRFQPALRGLLVWTALAARRSIHAQRSLPGPRLPKRGDTPAEAWLAWRVARRAMAGNFSFT